MGESASYDIVVPTRTALSGTPRVFLSAMVTDQQGNGGATSDNGHGRLLVTLSDCSTATTCVELSTGRVEVQNQQGTGPQLEEGTLGSVDTVVEAGHTLRLTVTLEQQGNATAVELLQGGDSDSRLVLTTTQLPVAVAGLGLLALLMLGGFAARPK